MVFVDPRVLKQLQDKESFEHEKLLEKNTLVWLKESDIG